MQNGVDLYCLPELLAPVSDRQMLAAAIHNGADAVYLGAPDFNARGRADLLSLEEVGEMIENAHSYGVKVYVALNVLIFEDELGQALRLYKELCDLNPDAFIFQDMGLARLVREIDPGARLHASTQMTIAGHGDIEFYSDLGFARYTLSRELTLKEVREVRKTRDEELETFIHGSLCIAYSGQCFTSGGFGGRSANRGECAQSCRHEYRLLRNSRRESPRGYLVSPMDLCAKEQVVELARMGVSALKIEGRLKSPEYVSGALRLYRSILLGEESVEKHEIETALTFHRGLHSGWIGGINHKRLVNPKIKSHQGFLLGEVQSVSGQRLVVSLNSHARRLPMKTGDGIYIEEIQSGGPIYGLYPAKEYAENRKKEDLSKRKRRPPAERKKDELPPVVELTLAKNFPAASVRPGMKLFLTSCHEIKKELKQSYTSKEHFIKTPLRASLSGQTGKALKLVYEDNSFGRGEAISEEPLQEAQHRGLSESFLQKELGALGATPFELQELTVKVPHLEETFLQHGMIKSLRKRAVEELLQTRKKSLGRSCQISDENFLPVIERLATKPSEERAHQEKDKSTPNLYLLLRRPEQALALEKLGSEVQGVYLDFTYGREYGPVIEQLRSYGVEPFLASERVMKDDRPSLRRFESLMALNPGLLLLRNAASFTKWSSSGGKLPVAGDFSFNVANSVSANYLLQKGFQRVTASYDLVFEQGGSKVDISRLLLMLEALPAGSVEVCLSYYLPAFYMEYCLFAAHYGKGGTPSTCGLPCKKMELSLEDRKGEAHPLFADQGCRNIMYNNRPKEIITYLPQLIKSGARHFRLEFLNETAEEIVEKTRACELFTAE